MKVQHVPGASLPLKKLGRAPLALELGLRRAGVILGVLPGFVDASQDLQAEGAHAAGVNALPVAGSDMPDVVLPGGERRVAVLRRAPSQDLARSHVVEGPHVAGGVAQDAGRAQRTGCVAPGVRLEVAMKPAGRVGLQAEVAMLRKIVFS